MTVKKKSNFELSEETRKVAVAHLSEVKRQNDLMRALCFIAVIVILGLVFIGVGTKTVKTSEMRKLKVIYIGEVSDTKISIDKNVDTVVFFDDEDGYVYRIPYKSEYNLKVGDEFATKCTIEKDMLFGTFEIASDSDTQRKYDLDILKNDGNK